MNAPKMNTPEPFAYKGVLIENDNVSNDWGHQSNNPDGMMEITQFPEGAGNCVSASSYREYSEGNATACADLMIVTIKEDGVPAVVLSKRSDNVCYSGKWWMHGGAVKSYRSLEDLLVKRVQGECGIAVEPKVMIGVYHTISEDFIGDTIQPCYAGIAAIDVVRDMMCTDKTHSDVRLFTLEELVHIPEKEQFWYPMRVARIVLGSISRHFSRSFLDSL